MAMLVALASVLVPAACGNDPGTVSTPAASSTPPAGELFPVSARESGELPFTLAANEELWRRSYSPFPGDIS